MRVLVLGGTGVLGRNVIPRLLERGHQVRALVRGAAQAAALGRVGVEAVPGDILNPACLPSAAEGCPAVLHLATAVPRRGGPQDWSINDRIRVDGTRNLLRAAVAAGVRRYVQQSITFLYGDRGGRMADEDAPLQVPERLRSAAEMEAMVREAPLEWCILRGGAFYGPGTGRDEEWRQNARDGTLRLPGSGGALVSLIHAVDMARAVIAAVEAAPAGAVYNVVDDAPVDHRTLYGYIAARAGGPEPLPGGPEVSSLGCSNARLRTELGWMPAYPSYRSGLSAD